MVKKSVCPVCGEWYVDVAAHAARAHGFEIEQRLYNPSDRAISSLRRMRPNHPMWQKPLSDAPTCAETSRLLRGTLGFFGGGIAGSLIGTGIFMATGLSAVKSLEKKQQSILLPQDNFPALTTTPVLPVGPTAPQDAGMVSPSPYDQEFPQIPETPEMSGLGDDIPTAPFWALLSVPVLGLIGGVLGAWLFSRKPQCGA